MQIEENVTVTDSSPPVKRWSRQKMFDIVIKKYMLARESEKVSPEVKEILESFVVEAFNESDIWLTHPKLVKTALSLLLDDLSEINARIFYSGLVTTLSNGIDQSVFEDMDDEPFFAENSDENSFGEKSVIDLSQLKELVEVLKSNGINDFSFENKEIRISLNKERKSGLSDDLKSLAESLSVVLKHEKLPAKIYDILSDELNDMSEIDRDEPRHLEARLAAYITEQK